MANLSVTAADVAVVAARDIQHGPAAEVITAGQYVRLDTSTGKWALANGTTAAEARCGGIAVNGASVANETISVVIDGEVDLGDALDALDYDQDVYLSDTDGTLCDGADGTVDRRVGVVWPSFGHTTADKILKVRPHEAPL